MFDIKNIIFLNNQYSDKINYNCDYNINLLNGDITKLMDNLFLIQNNEIDYNLRFNSVFFCNYTEKSYVIDENGNKANYSNIEKIDGIFHKSINPLNIGCKFAFYNKDNKLIGFGIDKTRRNNERYM